MALCGVCGVAHVRMRVHCACVVEVRVVELDSTITTIMILTFKATTDGNYIFCGSCRPILLGPLTFAFSNVSAGNFDSTRRSVQMFLW